MKAHQMTDWYPIETAPKRDEGRDILVWDGFVCDVVNVGWWEGDEPVWFNGDVRVNPTHWMPLPEPPSPA